MPLRLMVGRISLDEVIGDRMETGLGLHNAQWKLDEEYSRDHELVTVEISHRLDSSGVDALMIVGVQYSQDGISRAIVRSRAIASGFQHCGERIEVHFRRDTFSRDEIIRAGNEFGGVLARFRNRYYHRPGQIRLLLIVEEPSLVAATVVYCWGRCLWSGTRHISSGNEAYVRCVPRLPSTTCDTAYKFAKLVPP